MKPKLILVIALSLTVDAICAQESTRPPIDPRIAGDTRITSWLKRQDNDEDGKISFEESIGPMKSNFRRVDTNGDSFIDREELSRLADRLSGNADRTRRRRRRQGLTDQQVRERASQDVKVMLDIPYREGNDAWTLDLAMPSAESRKPRPAIVFVHGGGWVNGDKRTEMFIGQALRFAAKGYVCMSVNYRLDRTKLPCIQDVKCAVRWLRAHADEYNVDPQRIGAYGNSAGAHLVAMLGVSHGEERLEGDGPWKDYSSAVQAVAASATPTSPNLPGGSDKDRELIAPMSYVSANAPPMLFFHEASDRTVDVGESDKFVKALNEAGANDITYKRYTDGSGHGVFSKNLKETQAILERFFARTIGTE